MRHNGGTAKLSMVASSFGVAPLQHFGAIVEGPLDLRGVLSGDGAASMASELQSALDANGGLLVFRDQRNFGPEQHVALAELLGEIFPLPLRFQHARSPMPGKILRVSNSEEEGFTGVGTSGWHIDGISYTTPFTYSLLDVVSAPSNGPTLFMPLPSLADAILERRPHWCGVLAQCGRGDKTVRHPLIFSHPRTRRPGVTLGKLSGFIWPGDPTYDQAECEADDAAATKDDLAGFVRQHADAYAYRHEWREGDLVLWDNLAVAHLAPPETQTPVAEAGLRVLHRIVVAGAEPLQPHVPVDAA